MSDAKVIDAQPIMSVKPPWQEWQDARTGEVFVMVPKNWFAPRSGLEDCNELEGLCTCGAEAERDRFRRALEDIANLGPRKGEQWDEMDEADAFGAAQDRAREALTPLSQRAIAILIEDNCDADD